MRTVESSNALRRIFFFFMDDLCNWFTISITTRGEKIWKTFVNPEFYLKIIVIPII